MLPTKLARAALAGKRCSVVPPDAVVALMTVSRMCRRQRSRRAGWAVSGAALRCCLAGVAGPVRRPGAYVPTGYVPDGEVTGVTVSSRTAEAVESRWLRASARGEPGDDG